MTDVVATQSPLEALGETIKAKGGAAVLGTYVAYGELNIDADRDHLVELMTTLRDDPELRFAQLTDIAGVDRPKRADRFDVVYQLLSYKKNVRVRVKVKTDEDTPVPSVVGVWPNANWCEREAFDMYGIFFLGHPDLRRILTDYGFHGYPLRKDFPMTGYVEVRYDEALKRVVYEPVKLVQEFRTFDFLSPWEGASYVLPGDEKAGGKGHG